MRKLTKIEALKILGINTNKENKDEIKRAYRKKALETHPDRPGGDSKKFTEVFESYELLMENSSEGITKEAYDSFKEFYVGSEDELKEIISLYKKYNGNMFKIIDNSLLGCDEDEIRFREIIDKLIENGELQYRTAYKRKVLLCPKRKKTREKEAREAEKLAKELGIGSENPEETIQNRKSSWNSFLENLEEKLNKKKLVLKKRK